MNQRWLVPLFGLLLIATVWVVTLVELSQSHRAAYASATERSLSLLSSYASYAERTIEHLDQSARIIKRQYEQGGALIDLDGLAASDLLAGDVASDTTIVDEHGFVRASTRIPVGIYLGDQERFLVHRQTDTGQIHVSRPFEPPVFEHTLVTLSRRLNHPDGSFAGVVIIGVEPQVLTGDSQVSELGEDGHLALIGTDGVVPAGRWGQITADEQEIVVRRLAQELSHSDFGNFHRASAVDGVERFVAYRKLPNYPLVVSIGIANATALAGYQTRKSFLLTTAGVATVVLVTFFGLLFGMVEAMRRSKDNAQLVEARYRAATEGSLDAFVMLTAVRDSSGAICDFRVFDLNAICCRKLKLRKAEAVGRLASELPLAFDSKPMIARLATVVQDQATIEEEQKFDPGTGVTRWVRQQMVPKGDLLALSFRDVTAARESRLGLERAANLDPLTGLPNRHRFITRLNAALDEGTKSGHSISLLLIDMDDFKRLNDVLGHATGDRFLVRLARRIKSCLRDNQELFRPGGDEFGVLIEGRNAKVAAERLAQRIRKTFAQMAKIEKGYIPPSASIGISFFPEHADTAADLLRNAELAMYNAKAKGKNTHSVYTLALGDEVKNRVELERQLRDALLRNEFSLVYQPKLSLAENRISGFEALIRWQQPTGEMVSPANFIPVAEATGLIVPLGEWVLRQACKQLHDWACQGHADLRIAVNVSAPQFKPEFVSVVRDTLAEFRLRPHQLELELTESLIMSDPQGACETIQQLKQLGVSLSIDDFGTGYSSLAYLKRFEVDALKVDRSFVTDIPQDGDACTIAGAIVRMAHALGIKVVAEGVETQAQRDFLKRLGCDEIQGYLISKPVSAKAALHLVAAESDPTALRQLQLIHPAIEPLRLGTPQADTQIRS